LSGTAEVLWIALAQLVGAPVIPNGFVTVGLGRAAHLSAVAAAMLGVGIEVVSRDVVVWLLRTALVGMVAITVGGVDDVVIAKFSAHGLWRATHFGRITTTVFWVVEEVIF